MSGIKPRVGISYEPNEMGRDDGPALFWRMALKRLAEETKAFEYVFFKPNGDMGPVGNLDLLIWVDFGEDAIQPYLSYRIQVPENVPIAYVSSDTHLGWEYRRHFAAKHAKWAYFNQKRAVEEYGKPKRGQKVAWLPHAYEPEVYRPGVWTGEKWVDAVPMKRYDWSMVGHMQLAVNPNGMTRIDALDRLFREFPNGYYGSRDPQFPGKNLFEDAAMTYNASRAVFNISIGDDAPNMRDMEALGTRACMFRNRIPTLDAIFTPGTHYVPYDSYDSMVDSVKWILGHPEEAERIAVLGHKVASERHTYRHRALRVLVDAGVLEKSLMPPSFMLP